MRVTIIPTDGFVSVDGAGYGDLDLSSIDPSVHAVQWWGEAGEVEVKNPSTGKMVENRGITSLDDFQVALDAWQAAKQAEEAALAAAAAAEAAAAEAAALQAQADEPAP
jgi:hypothetical protein